jgi:hypothetical protein
MPFAPWQYGVFDCPLLQVVEHLIAGDAAVTDELVSVLEVGLVEKRSRPRQLPARSSPSKALFQRDVAAPVQ